MGRSVKKIFLWNLIFICCQLVVLITAASRRKDINILQMLEDQPPGLDTFKLSPRGWKFTQAFPSLELSSKHIRRFFRRSSKDLTFVFSGIIENRENVTLLGIYEENKTLPYLHVSVNSQHDSLIFRYQGTRSFQRVVIPLYTSSDSFYEIKVSLKFRKLTVMKKCETIWTGQLQQKMSYIPRKVFLKFGQDNSGNSKLNGAVFKAWLLSSSSSSKLRRNCASKDKNIQSDQGLTTRKELEERIMLLEEEVSRLRFTMDTLKAENNNLGEAVDYLQSSCVCTPKCSHNGTVYKEGESWNIDECTVCVCQNDEAICQYRTDLEICRDLCHQEPCFHGGECYHDANSTDFNCTCQSPYSGRYCETWQNPCVWPPDCGSCDANLTRFYYDRHEQDCMPFSYTGCGGNINNFEQRDGCESVSMTGACCHREFSTAVEDLLAGNQNFETLCEVLTYSDCQFVHRQPSREEQGHISEVVGFYPSLPCDVVDCGLANGCIVGSTVYAVDEVARIGCDDCICQSTGNLVCKCSRMNIRREIRDMTREEISRFQHAVSELRATEFNNTWEQFRDIYMTHSMHSNGGIYFLPWNRVFLRQLEMKLQDIDCGITLPYFDFTTDVGNFAESVIWQPNYFGGDGKEDGCVPDHSFGVDFWSPCISRRFNASVQLPTQVELIMALNSEELSEVSSTLETYVAYVHNFIGGDMSTSASPYDPVFYVIHSFVDMMYWVWQNRGENKFKFPAAFGNVPMVPYSTIPMSVLDSEESLCVTYSMPSKGNPCNVTEIIITDKPDFPGLRGDTDPDSIYKHDGFNQFGYDIDGFDRRGFNPYGYDIFGYNRDHINRLGYNKDGFNRFGLDINGFDTKGFNILGRDRYGNNDTSNMYDETGYSLECLNRGGLNPNGFDKNGYDVEGRDKENCNYFINGPYAPIQSFRIMEILLKQSKEFLMSIPRTCPPVKMLPDSWYGQFWTTEIRDVTEINLPDHSHREEIRGWFSAMVKLIYLEENLAPDAKSMYILNLKVVDEGKGLDTHSKSELSVLQPSKFTTANGNAVVKCCSKLNL